MIMAQLPRDLQHRLKIEVTADAYHIGGMVKFTTEQGVEFKTNLLVTNIEGVPVACMLPPYFIDHLCATA